MARKRQRARVPKALRQAVARVEGKRPRTVLDHILRHGYVTTAELRDLYGYNHPPRAARDVREAGIPLETFRMVGPDGRRIGAYRFGDPSQIERHKLRGRTVLPKSLRKALVSRTAGKCEVCGREYGERYLQVDHAVPYEVAGDAIAADDEPEGFLLLCASCQRSKSWSCEHCANLTGGRDRAVCRECFWARPVGYTHVAMEPEARIILTFAGGEVADYKALSAAAERVGTDIQGFVKGVLRRELARQ
jgi:hypothetical protein